MKVSIITAVFNGETTIQNCLESIAGQSYKNIEYIVIDGCSSDNTLEIIKKYRNQVAVLISEPDTGIYNALNKGIRRATGEIIGILHADDVYHDTRVIEKVVTCFIQNDIDACYGDLEYVDKSDLKKVVRYWRACPYRQGSFYRGWMPPHPTFFASRNTFERYGLYNENFQIAADYELMLRFIEKYTIKIQYIPEVLVKMRIGGLSNRNVKNLFRKTREDMQAWQVNQLPYRFYTILLKNLVKLPQFFKRMPARRLGQTLVL